MEGFGNYNPDDNRELSVVEKSMAAIAHLGEYVPDTWKNKLRLYDEPRGGSERSFSASKPPAFNQFPSNGRVGGNCSAISSSGGSIYSSGNFNLKPRPTTYSECTVAGDRQKQSPPPKSEFTSVEPGEYEARLVRRMVEPRGGRSRPTPSELTSFKTSVTGLDLNCLLRNLSEYICDANQTWSWRYRALATMLALVKPESKTERDLSQRVLKWLRDKNDIISVLQTSFPNRQCTSLAEQILQQLSQTTTEIGIRSQTVVENVDLLGLDESAPAASTTPATDYIAPASRPNLLDDLL